MSPKERLLRSADDLRDAAVEVREIAIDSHNGTVSGGQGEIGRRMLRERLDNVKAKVEEIERIVK